MVTLWWMLGVSCLCYMMYDAWSAGGGGVLAVGQLESAPGSPARTVHDARYLHPLSSKRRWAI
jgi:hypothetical protein